MNKLLFLLLFIPLVSFGQSQVFNGISFDAPVNFKLTGDLEWRNAKEVITIIENKNQITVQEFKSYCPGVTNKYQINGQELSICFEGDDTTSVASFIVYLNEYSFIVSVASNDPARLGILVKFMFESINNKNSDSVIFSDGKTFKIDKLNRDLIELLGQSYAFKFSPSTIKKFNSCFFKNIARESTYKKYSDDLQKSLNFSDIKERRSYYLYSIPYINVSLWKCMESNEAILKEMAETDLIVPQSDLKIKTFAEVHLANLKKEMGIFQFIELGKTINWENYSKCFARKVWMNFTPKEMYNMSPQNEKKMEKISETCMEDNLK